MLPVEPDTPMIDKSALRARPADFVGSAFREEGVAVKHTSGTTGYPVPILFDRLSALEHAVIASRRMATLYAQPADHATKPRKLVTFSVTESAGLAEEVWVDPWGGFVVQVLAGC